MGRKFFCSKIPQSLLFGSTYIVLMMLLMVKHKILVTNSLAPVFFGFHVNTFDEANGVPQDDESLLSYVRLNVLQAPNQAPYSLARSEITDQSMGQSERIRNILKNKTGGFFIECGALDGETRSNTLYMERFLGWQGLLVEADPSNVQLIQMRNRKSWLAPTCLGLKPHPHMVTFMKNFNIGRIQDGAPEKNDVLPDDERYVTLQCIPITSLLLAMNRTHVDYFSLDVEGNELEVLKTIDFDQIDITTLSVEFKHGKEGKLILQKYMESKGYYVDSEITNEWDLANDFIFVKKSSNS